VTGAPTESVALPASTLSTYRMFSLYNSPYAAHDEGRAVDLYPDHGEAPSPVTGEVLDTRSVRAPPKEYAEEADHLILIAVDPSDPVADGRDLVARVLHVDPGVSAGDGIHRGEDLGRTIRSGFFAPWVGDHLHVGFRTADANLYRASGSLPLVADAAVEPLAWDGTGTVVAQGPTYVILDRPVHPAPGEGFAGIATDDGRGVLDGGFPHYEGGGVLPNGGEPELLETRLGTRTGRGVEWANHAVRIAGADATAFVAGDGVGSGDEGALGDAAGSGGEEATGISFYAGRDRAGAKVVCPGHDFVTGDRVRVWIE
jgi:hypothetical protein